MAHAHKGKKKVSKAMGAILKAPKKVEKAVKHASKHWNDIQEFRQEKGIKLTVTGARIYTVVWKGCEYVVIEKHNGIGISPVGIPNRLPADDIFNIPKNIK